MFSGAAVRAARKMALELIMANHRTQCLTCVKNGACELQILCRAFVIEEDLIAKAALPQKPIFDSNPFLRFDPNLCIACQRCVGACNSIARNHTLVTGRKGARTTIRAPFGPDWKATACESCGTCAGACPTGALTEKRRADYREWEVTKTLTTCPHCATGCQYYLVVKDGKIVFTNENQIYTKHDPTFHGEAGLIREFCAQTGVTDLHEYTMYASCEPCFMCSGAMVWVKLGRLVYGASNIDLENTLGNKGCNCSKMVFDNSFWQPKVTEGVLREESLPILKEYFGKHAKG